MSSMRDWFKRKTETKAETPKPAPRVDPGPRVRDGLVGLLDLEQQAKPPDPMPEPVRCQPGQHDYQPIGDGTPAGVRCSICGDQPGLRNPEVTARRRHHQSVPGIDRAWRR